MASVTLFSSMLKGEEWNCLPPLGMCCPGVTFFVPKVKPKRLDSSLDRAIAASMGFFKSGMLDFHSFALEKDGPPFLELILKM